MYSYRDVPLQAGAGEGLFALVDTAFDTALNQRFAPYLSDANHSRLFSGTFAAAAEDYSPILIEVANTPSTRIPFLEYLLHACDGQPLLSFIRTAAPLPDLTEHLRQLLRIRTDDDQAFLLRFADVRMLPACFSALNPEQQAAFLGPISSWSCTDHLDRLSELTLQAHGEREIDPDIYPLKLDSRQLALLMEKTEVHSIVVQLERHHESFVADFTPAERIAFVERNSRQAIEYGYKAEDDRVSWCSAALRMGEHFYKHPRIAPFLEDALKSGESLIDAMIMIPHAYWEAARTGEQVR